MQCSYVYTVTYSYVIVCYYLCRLISSVYKVTVHCQNALHAQSTLLSTHAVYTSLIAQFMEHMYTLYEHITIQKFV